MWRNIYTMHVTTKLTSSTNLNGVILQFLSHVTDVPWTHSPFIMPHWKNMEVIFIYTCLSVCLSIGIRIHCLSGYLLIQFWRYNFNILVDVHTLNEGVHDHMYRILIFLVRLSCYKLDKETMVWPAISYSFEDAALVFCRMFKHIMKVCMVTGFWFFLK